MKVVFTDAMKQSDQIPVADHSDGVIGLERANQLTLATLLNEEQLTILSETGPPYLLLSVTDRAILLVRIKIIPSDTCVLQTHQRTVRNI